MGWGDSASACGGIGGRKLKMTHQWNLKAEWGKKDFKSTARNMEIFNAQKKKIKKSQGTLNRKYK